MHNSIEHEVYHAHQCKNVDILTFISMVNATSQSMKARKDLFLALQFLLPVKISCLVELSMKMFFNLGA